MNNTAQDLCPCGSGKPRPNAARPRMPTTRWKTASVRPSTGCLTTTAKACAGRSALALDDLLDDDELDRFHALDPELLAQLQIHLIEWLLADGSMLVHGVPQRIAEVLLGREGPPLSDAQREWFEALSTTPLGLYRVAEVGETLRLVNLLDPDLTVLTVHANFEAEHLARGLTLGARVLHLHQHSELSGPVYDLRMVPADALDEMVRQLTEEFSDPAERDHELAPVGDDRVADGVHRGRPRRLGRGRRG